MIINKLTVNTVSIPPVLQKLSSPPKQLFHAGSPLAPLLERPRVAIVGSRNISPYGREVTYRLARQLADQGIVIVSGLAFGVDNIAHQATLEASGQTIAVLPGAIEQVYPRSHTNLAARIIEQGGALISEYPDGARVFKTNFIARNRLVAGLAQVVLITEAGEESGSWYTGDFARKQGKVDLAVPGNITSPESVGTNAWIKDGARMATSYMDVLQALGLNEHETIATEVRGSNPQEQKVLDLLLRGINDGEQLLKGSALTISEFNQVLTMLEVSGKIRALGANQWAIC